MIIDVLGPDLSRLDIAGRERRRQQVVFHLGEERRKTRKRRRWRGHFGGAGEDPGRGEPPVEQRGEQPALAQLGQQRAAEAEEGGGV